MKKLLAGLSAALALAGCREGQPVLFAHSLEAEAIARLAWVLFLGGGAILLLVVAAVWTADSWAFGHAAVSCNAPDGDRGRCCIPGGGPHSASVSQCDADGFGGARAVGQAGYRADHGIGRTMVVACRLRRAGRRSVRERQRNSYSCRPRHRVHAALGRCHPQLLDSESRRQGRHGAGTGYPAARPRHAAWRLPRSMRGILRRRACADGAAGHGDASRTNSTRGCRGRGPMRLRCRANPRAKDSGCFSRPAAAPVTRCAERRQRAPSGRT